MQYISEWLPCVSYKSIHKEIRQRLGEGSEKVEDFKYPFENSQELSSGWSIILDTVDQASIIEVHGSTPSGQNLPLSLQQSSEVIKKCLMEQRTVKPLGLSNQHQSDRRKPYHCREDYLWPCWMNTSANAQRNTKDTKKMFNQKVYITVFILGILGIDCSLC